MADNEFEAAVADPPAPVEDSPPAEAQQTPPPQQEAPLPDPRDDRITELEKELQRLKSISGGRAKADQRQQELLDGISAMNRTMATFMAHQVKGSTPEELSKELSTIESDAAKAAQDREWNANLDEATTQLREALDGTGLDPAGVELAETREAWNRAKASGNPVGLFEAVALANRAALMAERKKIAEAAHAPAGDGTATKTDDSTSAIDELAMATLPAGGGPTVADQELYNRYGRGDVERTPEVIAAAKRLGLPI